MTTSFVVDTNVLTFAAGGHGDEAPHCTAIIFEMITNDDFAFALDTNGEILDEYLNNITDYSHPHTKLIQEYFEKQLRKKNGISHHIPIDESEVEDLEELGFHTNDLIFVRVAPETDSETITSCDGESLTKEEYLEWIEEELDVTVQSPEEFKEELHSY